MANWIYILARNDRFPDPMEEIAALAAIDEAGADAYLLLAGRQHPPMHNAQWGETVHVCTRLPGNDGLFRHATAIVQDPSVVDGATPQSVQPIYEGVTTGCFVHIGDFDLQQAGQLPNTVLPQAQQERLLRGRAFVKRLDEPHAEAEPDEVLEHQPPAFPQRPLPVKACLVVGLDPTAGTWESQMNAGAKLMPSVTIFVQPGALLRIEEVSWHMCNQDFLDLVQRTAPSMICIDGPCQTNGPQVLPDWSDWDREANDGKRRCELLLHQAGVHLFWTTNNTVFCFDGASRWIARSLRLYRDLPANHKAVETHPHGAFAFLWRQLGGNGRLPNKKTDKGRDSRLALLKAFVENVDEDQLHNHDAVDAACAALMAAFHEVGWVESYGDDTEGGRIWMPRIPM